MLYGAVLCVITSRFQLSKTGLFYKNYFSISRFYIILTCTIYRPIYRLPATFHYLNFTLKPLSPIMIQTSHALKHTLNLYNSYRYRLYLNICGVSEYFNKLNLASVQLDCLSKRSNNSLPRFIFIISKENYFPLYYKLIGMTLSEYRKSLILG